MWLNPPYGTTKANDHKRDIHTGHSNIKLFLHKLFESYASKDVRQATLLVRADCKASWFHPLWQWPICFCYDDIEFLYPDGSTKHHRFGTAFAYLGPNIDTFDMIFSAFGHVVLPR